MDKHSNINGAHQSSKKEYVIGLLLSLILTAIPFGAVIYGLGGQLVIAIILCCAVAQIFVQLIFFLHMNTASDNFWNTSSAAFVTLIIAIVVMGSMWIMNHLNHNMLMGH